ncbi:hypothetical protein QUB70_02685 [Microcoleus sp. A003_D6]|uniref:hypothetical protein n=1 Tax=Microcoleus sp. A003_D6 TaxID=3055266 RepID=UPI002FCE71C3
MQLLLTLKSRYICVHKPSVAVQKCDRPGASKSAIDLSPSASINVHLRFKSAIALCIELSELSEVQFNQEHPNQLKTLARVLGCPSRFRSTLLK